MASNRREESPPAGTRNALTLSGGFADLGIKDEYITPVIYRDWLPSARLAYERRVRSGYHRLECRYAGGRLASDLQPRDVRQHLAAISWSRMWPLRSWKAGNSGAISLSAGGGASSTFSDTDYRNPEGFAILEVFDETWYWAHAASLDVSVDWISASRRSDLSLRGRTPLVRILSRPDHAHSLSRRNRHVSQNFLRGALGGEWVPPWRNPAVQMELSGRREVSRGFQVEAAWQLGWWSAEDPLPVRQFSSDFLAGLRWSY